jgi:hypothetical protein
MKVCPILQSMNNHPQACLTDLCEWWMNGCPAHPRKPEVGPPPAPCPSTDCGRTIREVGRKVKK